MRAKGFTLIELVITVAIVGLIATLAVPVAQLAHQRSKEMELRARLREIRTAIDAYKQAADEGRIGKPAGDSGYPPSLEALVDGAENLKDPKRSVIYFLRRIPRDPMTADPAVEPAATWGKRSYASTADDPQEGEDVFDVFSLAEGSGINGIEYREW